MVLLASVSLALTTVVIGMICRWIVLLTSVCLALTMHGGYRHGIQMNGVAYFCESGSIHAWWL